MNLYIVGFVTCFVFPEDSVSLPNEFDYLFHNESNYYFKTTFCKEFDEVCRWTHRMKSS